MKIAVFGSNSLSGRAFIREYSKLYDIMAFQRKKNEEIENVKYVYEDFNNHKDILSKIGNSTQAIIYLAQSCEFRSFPKKAEDIFFINTYFPQLLANFAYQNNIKKFIYFSTGGVYKSHKNPITEEEKIFDINIGNYYSASKLSSEILLSQYKPYFKSLIIFRPFFIFGKGQDKNMLIPRLVENILLEKPIQLNGENGIMINPIHVSDVSKSIHKSLSLKGFEKINLSGNNIITIREISEFVGRVFDKKVYFDIQDNNSLNLIGKNTKLCKLVHKPESNFLDKLREVIMGMKS
jgi:UDP-glucose 4-epimerase